MKKVFAIVAGFVFLVSCENNHGEATVNNDGMSQGDTNGGLADTAFAPTTPITDTSKMEHRVDISRRDTFNQTPR